MFLTVFAVIRDVLEAAAAGAVLWGVVKYLPRMFDHARLVRENIRLSGIVADQEKMLAHEKQAAEAYLASSEGWKACVEQLGAEVKDLREEVHEFSSQLVLSVSYIVDIVEAERHGKPRPPVPAALRQIMKDVLEKSAELERESFPADRD